MNEGLRSRRMIGRGGVWRPTTLKPILVLSPRRQLAYKVRDELKTLQVAAHSFYHEEALEEAGAQEAFALLSLLAEPEDRVALRFLLGNGSTTWLFGQYAKLRANCEQTGISPRATLDRIIEGKLTLPGTGKLIIRYLEILARLGAIRDLKGEGLVDALFPEGAEATKILRDSVMLIVEEDMQADPMLDRLRNLITQPEMPEDENLVRIMSLQKSKGLTSKIVIVLGCIEGLVPFIDSDEPPAEQQEILREQRRLFYVAMTRPREILVLSSFAKIEKQLAFKIGASTRFSLGAFGRTIASRFLGELGPTTPKAVTGDAWQSNDYKNG